MKLLSSTTMIVTLALLPSALAFQIASMPQLSTPVVSLFMVHSDDSPSMYTNEPGRRSSYFRPTTPSRRSEWKHALEEAATTFAEYRELEAAGLLNEKEDPAEVKRKAAATFAAFANHARHELDNVNQIMPLASSSSSSQPLPQSRPPVVERVLVQAAMVIGKKTGQIFGGVEPENYRD